jgi:hypothetical protein
MTPQPNPTAEDMADFVTPIAEIPAPPPQRQSKGLSFDFNGLIGRLQTEGFDSLSRPQQELLYHLKDNPDLEMSPEQMAMFVTDTDKRLREQASPEAQARLANTQLDVATKKTALTTAAKESQEDAKKTYQRASNMVWLLDNLRGGKRGEVAEKNEKWRPRVGSVDGRWPSLLSSEETLGWNADFNSLKGMINLTEAQANRGQGSLTEGERTLMAQAASLGLDQVRDEAGFNKAFERMYDMAAEAQQANMKKLSGADKADPLSTPAQQPAATAPAAAPQPQPQFRSKEEIVQAVNAGKLTREQGVSILRSQFNNDFRSGQ